MATISLNVSSGLQIVTPLAPPTINLNVSSGLQVITPLAPPTINLNVSSGLQVITPLAPPTINLNVSSGLQVITPLAPPAPPAIPILPIPQPYHVRRYGGGIGDYDLSHLITSVSASKSQTSVYLSLTLAGLGAVSAIDDRITDPLFFYVYWYNQKNGLHEQQSELARVDFESAVIHRGGRNTSITLTGRADFIASPQRVKNVFDIEYLSSGQIRMPIDFELNVGDVAVYDGGQMTIGQITYSIGEAKNMTITAA